MADDNTIIEGTVKFRDGKKWKSRWCVMRRLSPVADCVHLQVYRDARARCAGAASKASLSLQQFLGCEAGFTLDKHSHTLALLCRDFAAVLAFETRERLMQWQVKVSGALGEARQFLVVWAGPRRAAGPARLHLLQRRFALTAGVPPRLLGVWELAHLRRFGVVEGRFCFEGGSRCGKGEGLHALVTDEAAEIARDFDLAARGLLSPRRRPLGCQSPNAKISFKKRQVNNLEVNTVERSLPPTDLRLYEDPCAGEEIGAISPYWPSAERTYFQDMGLGDTASVTETVDGTDMTPWNGNANVMLERCMSCISKLGALSRSSTAALTPGAKHFSPAWTMEVVDESRKEISVGGAAAESNALCELVTEKTEEICKCTPDRPPGRPPKPARLRLAPARKAPMPLPVRSFSHSHLGSIGENNSTSFGPYENYDVPKIPCAEVEGEYYDTPKRLKECLNSELFKITKSSTPNTLILKKPCGCLLTLGKKTKQPTVVDTDEDFKSVSCPCQRVTDWANNWIRLPYCKRNTIETELKLLNKENVTPTISTEANALYATVDLSRKTRRKAQADSVATGSGSRTAEVDEGPQANYENLNFALSLEHYENAKDLLRRAGVTQVELDALGANLRRRGACAHCGHPRRESAREAPLSGAHSNDEYLLMEPNSLESNRHGREKSLPAGYTPMSPIGSFGFQTLRGPPREPGGRPIDEKSASNPTLSGTTEARCGPEEVERRTTRDRPERRKRSSSADSSRFLDDVKELDGGRGSVSSVETLRDVGACVTSATCDCGDADSSDLSKYLPVEGRAEAPAGGNRDSSSSNDSGVSSWSLRGETRTAQFELPQTTAAARRRYRSARRATLSPHAPRRSRSSGGACASPPHTHKCCSAEAEVPVLAAKPLRGVVDTHSTSSGTSDMSDYVETLSICSSHSSSDMPITMRALRQTTSTLRPRSGKEYRPLAPHLAPRPP